MHLDQVPAELLDEDRNFTLVMLDGDGRIATEIPIVLNNPYAFDPAPFLPLKDNVPMSLPRFFEVAQQLVGDALDREGVEAAKQVIVTEEYPPEQMAELGNGQEVIAWRVLKRYPAKMDTKATGRTQRKSLFEYDLKSARNPNKVVVVESRPIDHLIEFSCWAKTNKQANSRALWLEKLFVTHSWAFHVQGVDRFFWDNRGPDTYMNVSGQRLFGRPLNFMVRFHEFEMKLYSQIKQFSFELTGD